MDKKTALILYVPVIHKGYLDLVSRHPEAESFFVLHEDFVDELSEYKEIRRINSSETVTMLNAYIQPATPRSSLFQVVTEFSMSQIREEYGKIITLNDEICRKLAEKYLSGVTLEFDTAFLKWDSKSVYSNHDVQFDCTTNEYMSQRFMEFAKREAGSSSDWWRQVGAVLVDPKGSVMLLRAHNIHVPNEHTQYIQGDVRDFVEAGKHPCITDAAHAEQVIIATAAREGVPLLGKHLYVTTFPCPSCANLIAFSGISSLYFSTGHASLDGEAVLKSRGIRIIRVI